MTGIFKVNKQITTNWERGVLQRRKGCYKEHFFLSVVREGLSKQVTFKQSSEGQKENGRDEGGSIRE